MAKVARHRGRRVFCLALVSTPVPEFSTTVEEVRGVPVVVVTGEMDLVTAPAVRAALQDAVPRTGSMVLDLSACTFLDSTGLHVLVELQEQLARDGERLIVACAPGGGVSRLITLTLESIITIRSSRDEAIVAALDSAS